MPSGFWTILIMFFISFSGKIKTQNIKLIKLWIGPLLLSFNPQNHLEMKTGEPGNWIPAQTKFYQRNLISQHIIIIVINNCFYSSSQKISFSHFHFFLHFLWSVVAGVSWSQLESAGVPLVVDCPAWVRSDEADLMRSGGKCKERRKGKINTVLWYSNSSKLSTQSAFKPLTWIVFQFQECSSK